MTKHSLDGINHQSKPEAFRKKMLDWYDSHRRVLPWRAQKGETPDPYFVWLSEIMLQQTTVQAVIPYFLAFTKRWPTVFSLADAEYDDVMSAWAGLGYYARARNLHRCAKLIAYDMQGIFPSDLKALVSLPGIGDYTSAAIRSIAFDLPSVVVDGNVERVMARYNAIEKPLPSAKPDLKACAAYYSELFKDSPGDYAQSLMDLGATICTPKSALCGFCPLNKCCQAYKKNMVELLPKKIKKKKTPKRFGNMYYIIRNNNEILLHRRPEKGLLGGTFGLPTTDWVEKDVTVKHLHSLKQQDLCLNKNAVKHVFTHFHLYLNLYSLHVGNDFQKQDDFIWVNKREFDTIKMPTVFMKAVHFFEK